MARTKQSGLFKRPGSPFWWISFTDPLTKKRVRISSETTIKDKAVQLLEQRKGDAWDKKNVGGDCRWTVSELLAWAKTTIWQECTRIAYLESTLKPLQQFFGGMRASDVGVEHVLAFRKERMETGVSVATAIHPLSYLSAAYEAAINCDKIERNPVRRTRKLYKQFFPASKAREIALDQNQQTMLLQEVQGLLRKVVAFALRTGMRQGEILRLAWDDVNYDKMQMRTWSMKGKFKVLKERFVPILPDVYEILQSLPRYGRTVFAHEDGRPLSKHGIVHSPYHRAVMRLAKIDPKFEDFDFHGLRHTFISEQLSLGGNIFALGKIVGHSNSVMTERYGHLSESKLMVEMNLLPRLKGVSFGQEKHTNGTVQKAMMPESMQMPL